MHKKAPEASVLKLLEATDNLARQAKLTKKQLDKVQEAADALVTNSTERKRGNLRKAVR